jgi:hypothetical protein
MTDPAFNLPSDVLDPDSSTAPATTDPRVETAPSTTPPEHHPTAPRELSWMIDPPAPKRPHHDSFGITRE